MPEPEHSLERNRLRQTHYVLENPAVTAAGEITEVGFVRRKLAQLRASSHFPLRRSSEAHHIDEIGSGDDLTAWQIASVQITRRGENFAIWRLRAHLARVARESFSRVNDEPAAIARAPAPRFDGILADGDQRRPRLGKCQSSHWIPIEVGLYSLP